MNWRRWWPQSMAAQLLGLLLLGLLISHGVGVLLLSSQREVGELHGMARRKALDLYAHLYRGTEALESSNARRVLQAAGDAQAHFALLAQPRALPAHLMDPGMARDLAPRLAPQALQVRACTGDGCTAERVTDSGRLPLRPVVMQAQRPDGQWLEATLWVEVRTRWWWLSSFWLQASMVPVFLAVCIAVRGLLKPGRALVAAAAQVSRGEQIAPLPIAGPREMREITQAFNRMQHRIGRFVDDRTRMLAAISHDFRTPITSLRLRVEMLDDPAQREPMLRTLHEMRSMVDATLQFARDDAEHEPTLDTDLAALVAEVIEAQRAMGRDVAWSAEPPQGAMAYRCRPLSLKRALTNLVDNAVRYGQRARLRLVEEPGNLVLEVLDQGPGIRTEAREAVFAPFRRLVAEGGSAPAGSGLGLAIARSCARAHGGDIELLDAPQRPGLLARMLLPR